MSDRPTLEQIMSDIATEVYGGDLFPPPDLSQIAALLKREGWSLDSVTAHVARRLLTGWAVHLPRILAEHGYVIVHPDDHPMEPTVIIGKEYDRGYSDGANTMHRRIFGEDTP